MIPERIDIENSGRTIGCRMAVDNLVEIGARFAAAAPVESAPLNRY